MQQLTTYLMTNAVNITRWAWWPADEAMLVADGEMTALGNLYYELATEQ